MTAPTKHSVTVEGAIEIARAAMDAEAEAIRLASQRLDENFERAVRLIVEHPGKVIVTGLGKSGHVGRKMASTLCSGGTEAVFLHASEAAHGDLGMYRPGDPTILISNSGTTTEILRLIPLLRQFRSPLIGIVGNPQSRLASLVDAVLHAGVAREADPLDLIPTASSTVAVALGDALTAALMSARRFTESDFARLHPGGQLGRSLALSVSDVMQIGNDVPYVAPTNSFGIVVESMTQRPIGAACVVDDAGILIGLITEGDIRRALTRNEAVDQLVATDILTERPVTVSPTATLLDAGRLMQNRSSQLSCLPVVDGVGRCLGLLRIHDIYQPDVM